MISLDMLTLLAAALLAAAPSSAAFVCKESARSRPFVGVIVSTYPTVVEHSKPLAAINAMHPVKKPKGVLSQGLTVAEYRLHYSANLEGACDKGCDAACAWVGAFTVDVTPVAVRIHIPREYRMGSCEYEQLMKHEREHDLLHRRRLGELAQNMRDALARAEAKPDLMGPIEARDRRAAFEILTDRMERVMRPIYDGHLQKLREENAALDSLKEYKRLGKACRNWVRKS
jgi:hypothetical protein